MAELVRLKQLMPDYYNNVLEMNKLLEVEQLLLDNFELALKRQQQNQFVLMADSEGLAVWEQMVGIIPDNSLDNQTRRYNVLAKLLPPKPITIKYLREVLGMLNVHADIKVDSPSFHVDVVLNTPDHQAAKRLQMLLDGMLPANLTFTAMNIRTESENGTLYMGAGALIAAEQTNMAKEKGA